MADLPASFLGIPSFEVPFRPVGTVGIEGLRDLISTDPAASPQRNPLAGDDDFDLATIDALVDDLRAAGKGSLVRFNVTGEDASPMLDELKELFERKFDEA